MTPGLRVCPGQKRKEETLPEAYLRPDLLNLFRTDRDMADLLPSTTESLSTEIRVSGTDELRSELLRSRLFETVSQQAAALGADPRAFEFGLVIKW